VNLSIVIPVLNEQDNVNALYTELIGELIELDPVTFEIIFVDDGSTDGTFAVLEKIHFQDSRVRVIRFRRNFGKSAALAAGFEAAQGEVIITMDGDLQDMPAEIPRFLETIAQNYDLVSGWKYPRLDPITKTFPSKVWNMLMSATTGVHLHDFNCGFKAYRREVTQELRLYGELHRYTPVLAHQLGYRVTEIKVTHRARRFGHSKYGFRRFARGFFDLLTVLFLGQYTWRPLHLFGWAGLGSFALGVLIGLYLTVVWFRGQGPIGNRPLLTLAVLLMIVGIQFFSIGLLAEMLTRSQSKDTSLYSVRRRLG
jgi:glycosyltransferase involved in cell wall biosynthesis